MIARSCTYSKNGALATRINVIDIDSQTKAAFVTELVLVVRKHGLEWNNVAGEH